MKRFCWWQMEEQEVWPFGRPREGYYYGRCACHANEKEQGISNGRLSCFWPEKLVSQCKYFIKFSKEIK